MARPSILRHSCSPSRQRADSPIESIEQEQEEQEEGGERHFSNNAKRRISNFTTTSISSFPESALPSESETLPLPSFPQSFGKQRPTFRVGSLRRSPLPDRLSPGRALRSPRRPRSRDEDVEVAAAPLVLLHVTVLPPPPRLPWRRDVLESTLPEHLEQQFGELRARSSGLVRQRGILVAHPQDEFDVLIERVLEALGLLPERIGLDGQFRPRTPGTVVGDEDELEGSKVCDTCQRVHDRDDGAGWQVRVYAANGLMRAGAWAAAWAEMERVDVEILPCIPDEIRRRLDAAQNAGLTDDEDVPLQPPPPKQLQDAAPHEREVPVQQQQQQQDPLPQAYRPKEIPLNVLLRNYFYLLLRDRRNMAILFLALTLLASTWYGMPSPVTRPEIQGYEHGDLKVVGDMVPSANPFPLDTLDTGALDTITVTNGIVDTAKVHEVQDIPIDVDVDVDVVQETPSQEALDPTTEKSIPALRADGSIASSETTGSHDQETDQESRTSPTTHHGLVFQPQTDMTLV